MKTFQYIAIAGKLESLINEDVYPIGEKLPSLRVVRMQYGISVGTALKAFEVLVDKGLVGSRERSGYVVLRKSVAAVSVPQALRKASAVQAVVVPREWSISFFHAEPDISLIPFNAIRRSLQQASRDLTGQHLRYEHPGGNLLLRQEIARRSFHWGGHLRADDVVITNGAMEAVLLCLRAVTQPGDTIVVETPFYYGLLETIASLSLNILALPGDTLTGIDVQQLDRVLATRRIAACLFISNFSNPNGVQLPEEQKRAIAAIAKRRQVPVIDDDIYGDLHFEERRPGNIKTYDEDGWVLLCASYSKSVAPGYRIGWCAGGRFTQDILRLKAATNVATASVVQLSLLSLLRTGAYDRHLRKLRPALHRLVLLTTQAIERYFPAGTRISRPMGGMVLWVELPVGTDAVALQAAAREVHIHVAPGPLFSNTGAYRNYLRISCNHVWHAKVERSLKRLGALAKQLAPGGTAGGSLPGAAIDKR